MHSKILTFLAILVIFFTFEVAYSQSFERIESLVGLGSLEQNNGVAVADYDGDNDLDIFVVAKLRDSEFQLFSKSKLYRNNSDGTFTDVTEESGLVNLLLENETNRIGSDSDGFKNGVSWGDYDNDGFPDVFFTHRTKVQLFHNNGNGTFTNVTETANITGINNCNNTSATWFDANNDGFLDIYVSDWIACQNNNFYINNGDGTFTNTLNNYFESARKYSYTSIPFDFNNDGWMDLFLTQDFDDHNDVFINQNGTGFIEQSQSYGLDYVGNDMGIAIGDYNNDGFFDLFTTGINANPLFTNNGDNTFTNDAAINNVDNAGWAWGTIFADFDLDGDEDLFVTNGFKENVPIQERNFYFENLHAQGENSFRDITVPIGFIDEATSVTPVAFDYDNDGDLDLYITNSDKASHFYENKLINAEEQNSLNWFKVALRGTTSNRDAIGTTVSVTTNSGTIHRYNAAITHFSQSLKPLHFGLADATEITQIDIKWPSGIEESYNNFNSNQSILFIEGNGFETYNIPEVIKITGCTDPKSCNYNPLATIPDDSCTYLEASEIMGNANPSFLSTETYSYSSNNQNSSFTWSIEGGEIINGHGSNTITVKWSVTEKGFLTIEESSNLCSSEKIELEVSLSTNNISENHSVARLWNEALLHAIRGDYARPTVHARNLFHTSVAMYDSWAIYDDKARTYLIGNTVDGFKSTFNGFTLDTDEDTNISRSKTISYAAYRLLTHRFQNSPSSESTLNLFDHLMEQLGYDTSFISLDYSEGNAAALGNYIAQTIINFGNQDGSREQFEYNNAHYSPTNLPLFPQNSGNSTLTDPNRWQPLSLNEFIDQSGNLVSNNTPEFLSPEWGEVSSFALNDEFKSSFSRDNNDYFVYHDPGAPPYLNLNSNDSQSEAYKWGFSMVSVWGAHLDPSDNVLWDISPKSIGNANISNFPTNYSDYPNFYKYLEGGDIGEGHAINPFTNAPYETQMVPRGDYARVLAEFWADGPDSETPPGHWFTLLNYVSDHPELEKKLNGTDEVLPSLEWDVKSYFLMGGTMHDAAISAWSIKGWYDYIRPISAIRYMASLGQSTDTSKGNYNIAGIPLQDGYIETVEIGDPLAGRQDEHVGKIKLYTWRGHDYIGDTETDLAQVGWILAENWWPYQRPSFVTPPFAGFVSGHSTYSRAAAELMTLLTGSEYFPGGYGEFIARKNEFLVFEEGPSVDVKLQWATYRDASDQCSLSRIWGGIHPPADDIPGRLIGEKIGIEAFDFGVKYFSGKSTNDPTQDNLIYPNPVNDDLTIFVTNTRNTDEFQLSDLKGSVISTNLTTFFTDFNGVTEVRLPKNLVSGIYILKINDRTKRIVKP